jgi:hypothetical protein
VKFAFGREAVEPAFELIEWDAEAVRAKAAAGRRDGRSVEVLREPFMQPHRHATRRECGDHRVGQLVSEHVLEQWQRPGRAGHRHADLSIVESP